MVVAPEVAVTVETEVAATAAAASDSVIGFTRFAAASRIASKRSRTSTHASSRVLLQRHMNKLSSAMSSSSSVVHARRCSRTYMGSCGSTFGRGAEAEGGEEGAEEEEDEDEDEEEEAEKEKEGTACEDGDGRAGCVGPDTTP